MWKPEGEMSGQERTDVVALVAVPGMSARPDQNACYGRGYGAEIGAAGSTAGYGIALTLLHTWASGIHGNGATATPSVGTFPVPNIDPILLGLAGHIYMQKNEYY